MSASDLYTLFKCLLFHLQCAFHAFSLLSSPFHCVLLCSAVDAMHNTNNNNNKNIYYTPYNLVVFFQFHNHLARDRLTCVYLFVYAHCRLICAYRFHSDALVFHFDDDSYISFWVYSSSESTPPHCRRETCNALVVLSFTRCPCIRIVGNIYCGEQKLLKLQVCVRCVRRGTEKRSM